MGVQLESGAIDDVTIPFFMSSFSPFSPSHIIRVLILDTQSAIKMAGEKTDYTLLPRGEITPLASHHARSNRRRTWQWAIWGILATLILGFTVAHMTRYEGAQYAHSDLPACPQYPAFNSTSIERGELEKEVQDVVDSSGFFDKSLKRLQGAVQIPTESFDDMGEVGEDSRWDIFKDFHAYLEQTFPLV